LALNESCLSGNLVDRITKEVLELATSPVFRTLPTANLKAGQAEQQT
jgi:hypothetical protein